MLKLFLCGFFLQKCHNARIRQVSSVSKKQCFKILGLAPSHSQIIVYSLRFKLYLTLLWNTLTAYATEKPLFVIPRLG